MLLAELKESLSRELEKFRAAAPRDEVAALERLLDERRVISELF